MTVAPCPATKSTVSISWSRLSIEHGPAMTVSDPSPITASSTRMTVFSGWNSRETSLYGLEIAVTRSTPGSAWRRAVSGSRRRPISPTTAIAVYASLTFSNGVSPSARIRPLTPMTSASVAPVRITTNIWSALPLENRPLRTKKQRSATSAHPARPAIPGRQSPGSVMPGR